MVLLKHPLLQDIFRSNRYLHSNMVLLKHYYCLIYPLSCHYLHSNMVLLKRVSPLDEPRITFEFTFQYGAT